MVASALLIVVPFLGMLAALCKPRMNVLGVQRELHPARNIDRCEPVHGLEACEDAWVHHDSGLAYLACSSLETRAHWGPGLENLDARALPRVSTDTLRLFSFTSRTHTALTLDLPAEHPGVWVHGLDALHTPTDAEPDLYTLFLVSHRPPLDRDLAPQIGADSVVELFETVLGSDTARYVGTVRDDLVRTPNSVVATGTRSFYVSNDHARKVHWTRKLELAYVESSEVAHCTLLPSGVSSCTVAAPGLSYPNGLAKGPGDFLYVASTYTGEVGVFEIQPADMSLVPVGNVWLERAIDNIHVSPTTGAVYAATFPKYLSFSSAAPTRSAPANPRTHRAPVEIWRIGNETDADEVFLGRKWRKDVVLADPIGDIASAVTTAAPWRDELLLTGYFTPHAVICKTGEVL
ncbi:hypothetical protein JCM3770_005286 [Rhodotorula araucariae]